MGGENKRRLFFTLLFSVLGLSLYITLPFIFEGKAFVIGHDIRTQARPWYTEFRRLIIDFIKTGTLPFWSWNVFLGNNFWSAKSFVLLGDVYNYLFLFINKHYYIILMLQTILKLLVSALSFYIYGVIRAFKPKALVLGSLLFAFSAWAMKFIEYPVFLSFYSLFPLYFAMLEYSLIRKKYYLFSLAVALLLTTNYYYFYTLTIFTVFYAILRMFELKWSLEECKRQLIPLFLYYGLGIGLTMVITLPTFLFITGNSRVFSSGFKMWTYDDIRVYFHLLIGILVPSNTFISHIISVNGIETYTSIYETHVYQTKDIMMWSGSLSVLWMYKSWFDPNRTLRWRNRIYIIVAYIFLFIPLFGSIFHGFSEPSFRWTLFFIFFNLTIGLPYVDTVLSSKQKFGFILGTAILLCSNVILLNSILNLDYFSFSRLHIIFVLAFVFLMTQVLMDQRSWYYKFGFAILEISLSIFFTFHDNPYYKRFDWNFIHANETVLGDYRDELKTYLEGFNASDDFFRIYAPYEQVYWYYSLNMSMLFNIPDVKTYDSTLEDSIQDLNLVYPFETNHGFTWDIKQADVLNYLSVKYAFVTSIDQVPFSHSTLIGYYRGLEVYENKDFKPIIKGFNQIITYDDYAKINSPKLINTTALIKKSDLGNIKSNKFSSQTKIRIHSIIVNANSLTFKIETDGVAMIATSIPFDEGWSVIDNNHSIPVISVNGGFIGFEMDEGIHSVEMNFTPKGFWIGLVVSITSLMILIGLTLMNKKSS